MTSSEVAGSTHLERAGIKGVLNNRRQRVLVATICAGVAACVVGYFARSASADGIPASNALAYSGMLYESGEPVTDDKTMQIAFYDDAVGGTSLCETTQAVTVDEGRFRVALDDTCTTAVSSNQDVWIEVSIGTETLPRTKVGAVPYAVETSHAVTASNASTADSANAASTAATLDDCSLSTAGLYRWNGAGWECSDAAVIDESGNVGIGETTPSHRLHVATGASKTIYSEATHSLGLRDGIYSTTSAGLNTTDGYSCALYKAYFPSSVGDGFAFAVHAGDNDNTTATRTFSVSWDGNVVADGTVTATGGCVCDSDGRLKEGVRTIENPLDKIEKLRGVTYQWKSDVAGGKNLPEGRQIGIVAQELERQFPELVETGDDGYKGIYYGKLTAVLLEAIKTQQAEIEELRERVDELSR